jgi:hypothetical protein
MIFSIVTTKPVLQAQNWSDRAIGRTFYRDHKAAPEHVRPIEPSLSGIYPHVRPKPDDRVRDDSGLTNHPLCYMEVREEDGSNPCNGAAREIGGRSGFIKSINF